MQTLNGKVIVFIWELNEQFSNDVDMQEINDHLRRLSIIVHSKSLKLFDDENNRNYEI